MVERNKLYIQGLVQIEMSPRNFHLPEVVGLMFSQLYPKGANDEIFRLSVHAAVFLT